MFGSVSLTRSEAVKLANFLTHHIIHCDAVEKNGEIVGISIDMNEISAEVSCDCGISEVISED